MNIRSNTAEFKRLDKAIVKGEADVEAARWRQAELAFEACTGDGAMKQVDYAVQVSKSGSFISVLVRLWRRCGENLEDAQDLPDFRTSYETTHSGIPNTSGAGRSRRAARQVPTDKKDQVDMLQKLISANPEAVDEALDDPVVKHRLKQRVDEDEAKRAARRAKAARQAREDPAGKVVRDAIAKMDLYARDLDMIAETWVYALEDIPPELKAKLAKAASRLEAAAHRFADATKGRRSLRAVK